MNLMFWKKKTASEDSPDDASEKSDELNSSHSSPGHDSKQQETSSEAETVHPAISRRRLLISAIIGALLLTSIALAAWKIFLPPHQQKPVIVDIPPALQPMPLPGKQLIKLPPIEFPVSKNARISDSKNDIEALNKKNEALQAQIEAVKIKPAPTDNPQSIIREAEIETIKKQNEELQTQIELLKAELPKIEKVQAEKQLANIEVLTKKNRELQAQIDALKNKQQRKPAANPTSLTTDKAQQTLPSGDISIGNQNPKATAMTLKDMIKAMNSGSGETANKTGK